MQESCRGCKGISRRVYDWDQCVPGFPKVKESWQPWQTEMDQRSRLVVCATCSLKLFKHSVLLCTACMEQRTAGRIARSIQIHLFHSRDSNYQRKFRSLTSDNMDS